jgi:DNA-binding XRE family transcriptional regulator
MTRKELYDSIEQGDIPLGRAIFLMRKMTKVNRVDFAKKIGVTKRTLEELEQGKGNPTVKTLKKVLDVFGFELHLRQKKMDP